MSQNAILFVLAIWTMTFASACSLWSGLFTGTRQFDVCADPKKINPMAVNLSQIPKKLYYCSTFVKDPVMDFCYLDVDADNDQTGKLTIHFAMPGGDNGQYSFTMKLASPGVYDNVYPTPDRKVSTYIAGVSSDPMCVAAFHCFSGGPWGGREDSGLFATVLCADPSSCVTPTHDKMAANLLAKVLPKGEKLHMPKENCSKAGYQV